MGTSTDPDRDQEVDHEEESPLETLWREVSEGRYPRVEDIQAVLKSGSSSDRSLGELLVQRRLRRS